jgi:biotin carboxylase
VEIARREAVAGVISPCTDVSVPTQAAVAAALGLAGPTPAAAAVCCDKIAFRQFAHRHGFPQPDFRENPDPSAPDFAVPDGRWIAKPTRSSGSKGVFILENAEHWRGRIPESKAFSADGGVLVEEFLDGWQGTAEGILADGDLRLLAVLDRETADPPYCATRGHRYPSDLPAETVRLLREQLNRLWSLLDYREGPFDCDFVVVNGTPFLLEATPRLGGNGITNLLRTATGFDLAEYAVRQSLRMPLELPAVWPPNPTSVQILGVSGAGELRFDADEAAALARTPWVKSLEFDRQPGTEVGPFRNGRDRVGAAILTADSRQQLDARIAEFHRRLDLRAEPVAELAGVGVP